MSLSRARCKAIALLKRRADLEPHAFIDYYETRHAPLILSLLPGIVEYRRNYADFTGAFASPGAAPFDFDVVTELWFADRAAYDRAMAVAARPDIAARIAGDEAHFLDREKTRMFLVEERTSARAAAA
ncbi:MAG TPA: EthD domain-containing protein [Sphingomonas sp.]|nr:EthD domain-containing protein [Sphingomonas sp.]